MKIRSMSSLIAACAISAAAAPAWADCQQELALLKGEVQPEGEEGAIAKDGSLAPLEQGESAAAETSASTADATGQSDPAAADGEVAKDGAEAPLETDLSGIATSGQEAAAQQDETAETSPVLSEDAQAALARAEAALQSGDETGCMEAVEEARSL